MAEGCVQTRTNYFTTKLLLAKTNHKPYPSIFYDVKTIYTIQLHKHAIKHQFMLCLALLL